ncbi:MAG TPA: AI-2E family transporter [Gemmatimonadales bacterium]
MALFVGALMVWLAIRVVAVLLIVLLAVLLAVFLSSVTDLLERRFRLARGLGLAIAIVSSTAALVALASLLVPPVIVQTRALIGGLPQTLAAVQAALERLGQEYPVLRETTLADPQSGFVAGVVADVTEYLRGAIVLYLRAGGRLLLDSAAILVMAAYFAVRPTIYRDGLLALVSPRYRDRGALILADMAATLRAWVTGQILAMVIFAALTALGLWALDVPFWLAFGLFAGLAALVPFFGTIVSTVLPALFVVGPGNWLHVLAVLAIGVLVHFLGSNVFVPWIMARTVAIPPALTIAGVLAMGTLLGPIGLIVAVPLLALGLVLVRHLLHGEVYGEGPDFQPAVLRPSRARRTPLPATP